MELSETEKELTKLWKIAGHTESGCVAIMRTLNELISDEHYDQDMLLDAMDLIFWRCQQMQIKSATKALVGEL